jgi:hypothetical protein
MTLRTESPVRRSRFPRLDSVLPLAAWQSASDGHRAFVLACFCAATFVLVNWRNYVVDDIPQSLVPVTLWREGTIRLDSYRPDYEKFKETRQEYAFTEAGGHLYPRNSVYVSLLVAPFYLPPVLGGVNLHNLRFWVAWGGVCVAGWTACAVALTYLTLLRWGDSSSALVLSLLYAFGTCLWTIIAHTIYDHLGGLVCVAALVFVLDRLPLPAPRAFVAAFLAGAAVGMRPSTLVLLLPLGLYLFFWPGIFRGWQARLAALVGVVLIPLSNAVLNSWCFGGWNKTGYPADLANDWGNPWWEGLTGLLIAPNSGLFTQSPFTLLAVVGGWWVWTRTDVSQHGLLRAYTLCFVAYWLLFAHRNQWQGGLDFSTRYLSEGYPLWMPLVMVGWNAVRPWRGGKLFLAIAGAWSVLYQLANIATFDAITHLNPPHIPWDPRRHFFMVYLGEWGWRSAARAILLTVAQFVLCVLALACMLRPLLKPGAAGGGETAPKGPDREFPKNSAGPV